MDTKRFELTDAEIGRIIESLPDAANEVYPCLGGGYFHTCCHYQEVLKAQVAKVLSHFEPVELEALGDEEMDRVALQSAPKKPLPGYTSGQSYVKRIVLATVQQNQSKGQLFRLKEG